MVPGLAGAGRYRRGVVLLLIAVGGGLIAGVARAPLGARALRIRLHRVWLLGLGAVLNAGATVAGDEAAVVLLGTSLVALLAFALSNPHVTGIAVIGVGLLANLVALVGNGGMPVRGDALVAAGLAERHELATVELDPPRHLERSSDRLAVLGDVLPIAPVREVASFGDLIVVVGLADVVRDVVRRRRRPWTAEQRARYVAATTQARVDHDCGTAPSGAPDSGSQCSAYLDLEAPATSPEANARAAAASPALTAASHVR